MLPELLACGGELKNTSSASPRGRHAILSQHIGDLENYETLVFFEETLANLKKLFRVDAARRGVRSASGLPEHEVCAGAGGPGEDRRAAPSRAHRELHGGERTAGEVIGVALDGTGYGTGRRDLGRRVPGGGLRGVRRGGRTCATCRWPAATRRCAQPWRSALGYLHGAGGAPGGRGPRSGCAWCSG